MSDNPNEMRYAALAIGGSAGSLAVVMELLEALPGTCRLAVVICIHTASSDMTDLCQVLSRRCALPVVEARETECAQPGRVHVAAGGYHLLVERDYRFSLCAGARVHFVRPSIDIVFETMAEAYRERLIGVLLSGANADGAAGLRYIAAMKGITLLQDPQTAVADQMPEAALSLMTPYQVAAPAILARELQTLSSARAA